jgi:hypothetical protein
MPFNNVIQIPGNDGCVYLYNFETWKAQRLCDLKSPLDFPNDVKIKIGILNNAVITNSKE